MFARRTGLDTSVHMSERVDGLPFEIPASDIEPAPKPLEQHWQPDQKSMQVYLGIPEHRVGGHNVSMVPDARHTRFLAEVLMQRDENTGLGGIESSYDRMIRGRSGRVLIQKDARRQRLQTRVEEEPTAMFVGFAESETVVLQPG